WAFCAITTKRCQSIVACFNKVTASAIHRTEATVVDFAPCTHVCNNKIVASGTKRVKPFTLMGSAVLKTSASNPVKGLSDKNDQCKSKHNVSSSHKLTPCWMSISYWSSG